MTTDRRIARLHYKEYDSVEWQNEALCSRSDLRNLAWFPDEDEYQNKDKQRRAADRAAVRRVCAACPVQMECHDYAERTHVTAGIWAGRYYGELRGAP